MNLILGRALTAVLAVAFAVSAAASGASDLLGMIAKAAEGKDAKIGVAVIIDGRDTISFNDNDRYPLMSVFKFHQSLAVADSMKRAGIGMDEKISIGNEELKKDTYSPLRDKYKYGGVSLSIGELLGYTLRLSDNNACDILFNRFGGVRHTDRFIRSLGIDNFNISYNEADMHEDLLRCYANWTTPSAAATLLDRFLTRLASGDERFSLIKRIMIECTTGADRLAAALKDKGVVFGHKTGTGDSNAEGKIIGVNDIGFVYLPNGHRYTIAVFIKDSGIGVAESSAVIARISAIVYRYASRMPAK